MLFQVLDCPVEGDPMDGLVLVCLVRRLDENSYRLLFEIPHVHFDWRLVSLFLSNSLAALSVFLFFFLSNNKSHKSATTCVVLRKRVRVVCLCVFCGRERYCFQTHGGCLWLAAVHLCNDVEARGAVPHVSMRGSMWWVSSVSRKYKQQNRGWCNNVIQLFKCKRKQNILLHDWV